LELHQIINLLYDKSKWQWSDTWSQSQNQKLRKEKKVRKATSALTEQIRNRSGLHIELLPEPEEDGLKARMTEYDGGVRWETALRRRELKTGTLVLGKQGQNGENKVEELEKVIKINT